MKEGMSFFLILSRRWLRLKARQQIRHWHISFVSIAFYGIALKYSDADPEIFITFAADNIDYQIAGVVIEVCLRRRSLFKREVTIPKQPER
jgi:hypothetical protein